METTRRAAGFALPQLEGRITEIAAPLFERERLFASRTEAGIRFGAEAVQRGVIHAGVESVVISSHSVVMCHISLRKVFIAFVNRLCEHIAVCVGKSQPARVKLSAAGVKLRHRLGVDRALTGAFCSEKDIAAALFGPYLRRHVDGRLAVAAFFLYDRLLGDDRLFFKRKKIVGVGYV